MKGYKATDKNGECRGFKFKVGKTYKTDGIQMCAKGFHFCANLFDVYNYYEKTESTRVFEVEAKGTIQTEGDKSATDQIYIIRELTDRELLKAWITRTNSGNRNSGDGNSGYGNSGDGNSGYGNSGNRNSGDWNSGDGNSGYFNTTIPVYFFNKPSTIPYSKGLENKLRAINVKPVLTYITSDSMTEEEKTNNPSHKVTGGFLRKTDRMYWGSLTDADKQLILSLPNYDDDVFEQISGIRLLAPRTVKVTVNGVDKEIDYETAKKLGLI